MTQKLSLRQARLTDSDAIAAVYLSSRNTFIAFAPLVHSDAAIYQWVREKLIPSNQVIIAEKASVILTH